jgi:hypothetical protein
MGFFGKKENENEITEEYLMTVGDQMELGLVEGILRYEGIPMIKRYLNCGSAYSVHVGDPNRGIEVYVSSEDIERAREAIQKEPQNSFEAQTGEGEEQE